MEMKSMKLDKPIPMECSPCLPDSPEYPYGLHLNLNEEVIKKLGIELPEAGKEITITAKARVDEIGDYESLHGRQRSLGLQITDMAFGDED